MLTYADVCAVSLQHASCIANGLVRLGHAPVPLLVHLAQVLLVFPTGIFPSSLVFFPRSTSSVSAFLLVVFLFFTGAPLVDGAQLARLTSAASPHDASGPLSLSLLSNALCKTDSWDPETLKWISRQASLSRPHPLVA